MKTLALNPNTNIVSVIIMLNGYFGVGQNGIKFADQDTVYPVEQVDARRWYVPLSTEKETTAVTDNKQTNPDKPWLFKPGQSGNPAGRPRNSLKTKLIERAVEIAETKTYEVRTAGGGKTRILAIDVIAEGMVDDMALKKNTRVLEMFLDRTEGKVAQTVQFNGAIAHGVLTDEEMHQLAEVFPRAVPQEVITNDTK